MSRKLEQFKFKLEKKYWDLETCRKIKKITLISANFALRKVGLILFQSCHHCQVFPIMKLRIVRWMQ